MNNDPFNHITPKRLMEYINDLKDHLLSQGHIEPLIENNMFWSYVAGREHKEKPAEPIKPVKASWVKHEN